MFVIIIFVDYFKDIEDVLSPFHTMVLHHSATSKLLRG